MGLAVILGAAVPWLLRRRLPSPVVVDAERADFGETHVPRAGHSFVYTARHPANEELAQLGAGVLPDDAGADGDTEVGLHQRGIVCRNAPGHCHAPDIIYEHFMPSQNPLRIGPRLSSEFDAENNVGVGQVGRAGRR